MSAGAILQARPISDAGVGVLYTDPVHGDRARTLFENIVRGRVERLGGTVRYALSCVEDEDQVVRSLQHLLRIKPASILIASTTAPAGPEDVVGRAMVRIGAHMERFLAPVEPGNLMLLSYKDDVPMVSAPCCFRSSKPNILGSDFAAHAGEIPDLGLGNCRAGTWRIAGLTPTINSAGFCSRRMRLTKAHPVFFWHKGYRAMPLPLGDTNLRLVFSCSAVRTPYRVGR